MAGAFDHFTGFFHQDALLDGDDLRIVASKAMATMSQDQLLELKAYLNHLLGLNDRDAIIAAWNRSKADFIIRGGRIKAFLRELIVLADHQLASLQRR